MNKKLLLVLILALVSVHCTELQFDLHKTQYIKANDYWTVRIPCTGGSGQYDYTCELPTGWKLENNHFKIPSPQTSNYNSEYVARCKVKDQSYGSVLQRSLTFKCTSSGFIVSDHDYYYGKTAYTTGTSGSITGLDVLKRLNSLGGSLSFPSGSYSSGSSSGSYSSGSSSGSYSSGSYGGASSWGSSSFSSLPSWSQVDVLIKDGDISELLQLIQKVVASDLKCDAKTAYLSDLLGRICSALQIKKESVHQLKVLIKGALEQIDKLKIQISQLESQQSALNIASLKATLEALLVKLKAAYAEYNNCTSNTSQYQQELADLKAELAVLEKKVTEITAELEVYIQKLNSLNSEIDALEQKLSNLKQQRQSIEEKIASYRAIIKSKNTRITEIKDKIQYLIKKIKNIDDNCQNLQQAYHQIEIKVKEIKAKIESAHAEYQRLDEKITSINIEIERIQSQIDEYQLKLKHIQQCIDNLNSAIHEIKQTINYIYYHCHDAPDVIIDDDYSEPCFKFGKNQWFNYLKKCYGSPASQISVAFTTTTIEITTINIFSSSFESNYGYCFGDQVSAKAKKFSDIDNFGFDGDFQCSSNYSGLISKNGKIKNITSSYVDVDGDDGSQYRLKLGSCSRFEGKGKDFVPKPGHNIIWKGSQVSEGYNLHSCTCY